MLGQHQKGNHLLKALLLKWVLIEPSGLPMATHSAQVLKQL